VTSVALATEDQLSEALGKRLLVDGGLNPTLLLRRNGSGYLRSNVSKWCEMARSLPVMLMTDLDRKKCASALIDEWFGTRQRPKNLLVRVAVREAESWVLADSEGLKRFLGVKSLGKLPTDCDIIPDPKQKLLEIARSARRDLKDDIVAAEGVAARQGLGYNARFSAFVAEDWSPERASRNSDSLRRARARLADFIERRRFT